MLGRAFIKSRIQEYLASDLKQKKCRRLQGSRSWLKLSIVVPAKAGPIPTTPATFPGPVARGDNEGKRHIEETHGKDEDRVGGSGDGDTPMSGGWRRPQNRPPSRISGSSGPYRSSLDPSAAFGSASDGHHRGGIAAGVHGGNRAGPVEQDARAPAGDDVVIHKSGARLDHGRHAKGTLVRMGPHAAVREPAKTSLVMHNNSGREPRASSASTRSRFVYNLFRDCAVRG